MGELSAVQLAFAPRAKLVGFFEQGWRLIPGHDYRATDWAILVFMPKDRRTAPAELIARWASRFERPRRTPLGNKSAAARRSARG
jgi:hypothetical protein